MPAAVAGVAEAALVAGAARDLERHRDPIAGLERADVVADRDQLADALVAEREGPAERRPAVDHQAVEVAGRDRQRPHQRVGAARQLEVGDLERLDPVGLDQGRLLHGVAVHTTG